MTVEAKAEKLYKVSLPKFVAAKETQGGDYELIAKLPQHAYIQPLTSTSFEIF